MEDPNKWVEFKDSTLARGFVQIPCLVYCNPHLSVPAKYIYGLLLRFAWNDPYSFPGVEKLREMTGFKADTLRKYRDELVSAGIIDVKRRGQGKSNLYIFNKLPDVPPSEGFKNTPYEGSLENTPQDSGTPDHPQHGDSRSPAEGSPKNTQRKKTQEKNTQSTESTNVLSGGTAVPPENKEVKPVPMGRWAVAELMDRIAAAKKKGLHPIPPTERHKGDYGQMFIAYSKDGYDHEILLSAFDFMVAKASGQVDGEHKAWCNFGTAVDRVLAGWPEKESSVGKDEVINPASDEAIAMMDKPRKPEWYVAFFGRDVKDWEQLIREGLMHTEIIQIAEGRRNGAA